MIVDLTRWWLGFCIALAGQSPPEPPQAVEVSSPEKRIASAIHVDIRTERTQFQVGGEVMVEFVLQNRTGDPVTLAVPEALTGKAPLEAMGLPLEHVFSGAAFRALEVVSDMNPYLGDRIMRKPEYPVPPITLSPYATVGLRFDVARFYPVLHHMGTYRLRWRPYGGALETEPLVIEVVQFKQVVVETDYGNMTWSLLYDKAPRHVENFLELVGQRFYNGKPFHLLYPNEFILGGCPKGDGTGRRSDGICLQPEYNDVPFDVGTVAMALVESEGKRDENSASCQFMVSLRRHPDWDGKYTAFAQIQGPESLATLQKLSQVETDPTGRPAKPLLIKSMSAVDAPPAPRSANR